MANEKRLIDANEPINAFKRYAKTHPNATWNAFGIEEVLNAAKIVDAVEVVHGKWVWRGGVPWCGNCGEMLPGYSYDGDITTTNFCPNCGAKMNL